MVNSLLWDEGRNCLWVGTEGALFQYIPDTRQINKIPSFPANSFKTLTLDGKKDLVVGTDNGLYIYGVESHKLETNNRCVIILFGVLLQIKPRMCGWGQIGDPH